MSASLYRYRGLIAYVILAMATIFAIIATQRESDNRTTDVRAASALVVREGCLRDRNTVNQLRSILRNSRPRLKEYRDQGILNDDQYVKAIVDSKAAEQRLAVPDCKAIVANFLKSTK